ncbi:MAG: hypothetical protein H0V26_10940, partial [Solirubrobacterales bacterium]|nr:hypothetical protein [Solirubrobacterales bacterium]
MLFLAGFALALALVIGMSGAGSSTQARAQTSVDRSPERRRAPRRPRVVSIGWAGDTVLGSRHG